MSDSNDNQDINKIAPRKRVRDGFAVNYKGRPLKLFDRWREAYNYLCNQTAEKTEDAAKAIGFSISPYIDEKQFLASEQEQFKDE